MKDPITRQWLLVVGAVFESAIALLALGIGWWVGINPLKFASFELVPVVWGVGGAFGLFLLLLIADRLSLPALRAIKRLLIETLAPALDRCRWYEVVLLSLFVGFCEELMFRGLLQVWLETKTGYAGGLIWSNVLFGLVHCATVMYGVLAGLIGVCMGLLFDAPGTRNLLTPMIAHGVYDYLAFVWIVRAYRAQTNVVAESPENREVEPG